MIMRLAACCLFCLPVLAASPAGAQTIPPEVLHDDYRHPEWHHAIPLERSPEDSLRRIREARRALRLGKIGNAKRVLGSVSVTHPHAHTAYIRYAGWANSGDPREPLMDSLGLYLKGRDALAYVAARGVNRRQAAKVPSDVDAEASLIKSLLFLRAGILAGAHKWALHATSLDPEIPQASALVSTLGPRCGYPANPDRVLTTHPNAKRCRVEVWKGKEDAEHPLAILFEDEDGAFIGALIVERVASDDSGTSSFELRFRDLFGPPIWLRDYGDRVPEPSELLTLADRFHPEMGPRRLTWTKLSLFGLIDSSAGVPSVLRCELESLYWQRERAWPLAAWWIRQQPDSGALVQHYEFPLRQARQWDWQRRERFDVDGSLAGGGFEGFTVIGFANAELEGEKADAARWNGPLEHFHFTVVSGNTDQYVFSFVVTSREPIPGERLYFLQQVSDGRLEEIALFEELDPPDYETAREKVRELLYRAAAAALGVEYQDERPAVTLARRAQEETARQTGQPIRMENSIGMTFSLIPGGEFLMGSPDAESPRDDDETRHRVLLTRPFYMGVHEVTQQHYLRVMGENPSHYSPTGEGRDLVKGLDTSQHPVESVSWQDAQRFCDRLSALPEEEAAGRTYGLPTEAEWEYACRALTTTRFPPGYSIQTLQGIGNFRDASYERQQKREVTAAWDDGFPFTAPVGRFPPNAWGLFDMHGNVAEWCHDLYSFSYYRRSPRANPGGAPDGDARVVRGGSYWHDAAFIGRAAKRGEQSATRADSRLGFRVVCSLPMRELPTPVHQVVVPSWYRPQGIPGDARPDESILHVGVPEFGLEDSRYWLYVSGQPIHGWFRGSADEVRFHDTDRFLYVYTRDGQTVYSHERATNSVTLPAGLDLVQTRTVTVAVPPGRHKVELLRRNPNVTSDEKWVRDELRTTDALHASPFLIASQEVDLARDDERKVLLPIPYYRSKGFAPGGIAFAIDADVAEIVEHRRRQLDKALEAQAEDRLVGFLERTYQRFDVRPPLRRTIGVPLPAEHGGYKLMDGDQIRTLVLWLQRRHWAELRYALNDNRPALRPVREEVERQVEFLQRLTAIADALDSVPP